MSEIAAEQLAAVATLALAVLALATAVLALLAWRKQSREVRDQAEMLKLQAEELRQVSADREREAQARHRAQAAQVYIWIDPVHVEADGEETPDITVRAHVRNTSPQPIYDLCFEWFTFTLDADRPTVLTYWGQAPLTPGDTASPVIPKLPGFLANPDDVTVAASFRDRNQVTWRIQPGGYLEEFALPEILLPEDGAPTGGTSTDVG
jgi:hypothetical protein